MSEITHQDIMRLDELEAKLERVLKAVRGCREDEAALIVATALHAVLWIPNVARFPDEDDLQNVIDQLRELALEQGKGYAQAMIAEGTIWGRVRETPQ